MLKYIQENYIQNTNIIDLGGNIGTTTLLMSEVLSDNSNIYTFEPMYSDILLKNILDNNLLNKVKLYPYGVGNKLEVLKIKNFDYNLTNNFGAFSIIENVDNSFESLEIHITPLDIYNFENVSLIKIDVENMEIEVLEGAINLLKRCKPTIIIETHQFDKFVESNIFKELLELGYLINRIPEGCNDFIMKINTN
jgi:FkbM family methyltransferase